MQALLLEQTKKDCALGSCQGILQMTFDLMKLKVDRNNDWCWFFSCRYRELNLTQLIYNILNHLLLTIKQCTSHIILRLLLQISHKKTVELMCVVIAHTHQIMKITWQQCIEKVKLIVKINLTTQPFENKISEDNQNCQWYSICYFHEIRKNKN